MHNKVVIVGCGNVGMSYAYALLNQRTNVNELILIDLNKDRALGEAMDLNHCLAFAPSKIDIRCGDYTDCSDAKIVVIAAGANQNKGESRMDLIYKNSKIFKSIVGDVVKSGFKGIFLVATNPLDVMTYLTWKYSGFDYHRVLGSGTSLDTSRLRYLIGDKLGIGPKNIHAYVIGEHGDSEFVPWSNATVGLQNVGKFLSVEEKQEIADEVKNAAYKIIERKGATYYGIGMCLVSITNAILGDENRIITVSTYDKENDVFIGLPTIVNKRGAKGRVFVDLTEEESLQLQHSIDVIKEALEKIK
ncbi:MAG TPA: L-lactate dehydrogenase [Candidatus Faecimonas intestinavium]|jgi:L-lactate dehydrogenase|nr:L-lactate dehydrogenase [Candidatus Faecimonas intestinavium]